MGGRRGTSAEAAFIRELLERGEAAEEIAVKVGRSASFVHRIRRELEEARGRVLTGRGVRRPKMLPWEEERIERFLREGVPGPEIAARTGRSPDTIRRRARELGVKVSFRGASPPRPRTAAPKPERGRASKAIARLAEQAELPLEGWIAAEEIEDRVRELVARAIGEAFLVFGAGLARGMDPGEAADRLNGGHAGEGRS